MKCPRCGTENQEDARYCCKCGQPRYELEINTDKKPLNDPKMLKQDMPMVFHWIYAIGLLILSIIGFFGSIGCLFDRDLIVWGLMTIIPNTYLITTSILLLLKNKVGNIMRLIHNIVHIAEIAFSLMFTAFVAVLFFVFAIVFVLSETEGVAIILALMALIVFILIVELGFIVFNALVINYYHKRKHMFK